MAHRVEYHHCELCGEVMPHNKKVTNHILHLLLTVITAGLWAIVWLLVGLASGDMVCGGCGLSPSAARRKAENKQWKEGLEEKRSANKRMRRERKDLQIEAEDYKRSRFLAEGPPVGKRLKVENGPHKGKFGTVTEKKLPNITLADKSGRTIVVHVSELLKA